MLPPPASKHLLEPSKRHFNLAKNYKCLSEDSGRSSAVQTGHMQPPCTSEDLQRLSTNISGFLAQWIPLSAGISIFRNSGPGMDPLQIPRANCMPLHILMCRFKHCCMADLEKYSPLQSIVQQFIEHTNNYFVEYGNYHPRDTGRDLINSPSYAKLRQLNANLSCMSTCCSAGRGRLNYRKSQKGSSAFSLFSLEDFFPLTWMKEKTHFFPSEVQVCSCLRQIFQGKKQAASCSLVQRGKDPALHTAAGYLL